VAIVIFQRAETAGVHPVDVESAIQMVNFVLKDASILALRLNKLRFSAVIQARDLN